MKKLILLLLFIPLVSFGQNKYSIYKEKDVNSYTKSNLLNDVSKTFRDLAKQNVVKRETKSDNPVLTESQKRVNLALRKFFRDQAKIKDSIKFLKKNNKYVRFKCKDKHPNDKTKIKACKRLKRMGYL